MFNNNRSNFLMLTLGIILCSLICTGCITTANNIRGLSYKELRLDTGTRKFSMEKVIVSQLENEMSLRKMGFFNLPSPYYKLGWIGYDMAYNTTTFTSSNSSIRTIRDVYDTPYGQIVIEKANYITDNLYELLFAFGLAQLVRYETSKIEYVLKDGYFDFNIETPAGQNFTCRIPSLIARKYIDYVMKGQFLNATANELANEIVAAMEI